MFYEPNIKETLCLGEEESQHCVQVLRASVGDRVQITDGCGMLYEAEIVNPHRKHCEVKIISEQKPEPLHKGWVHIAIAPTKNIDRLEWMIEKCTEMGVDEITPILCRYSERKTVNNERLQRIMVAAAKQSLKVTYPLVHGLTRFEDLINADTATDKLIAHCEGGYEANEDKWALKNRLTRGNSVTILIGPEGDFSVEEIELAKAKGYLPISLGKARLRTETAGLVACHTALLVNE